MKNILILEDNDFRINFFKNKLNKFNLFIFKNVQDAIKCINENKIDILFLDHDLDKKIFVSIKEENTGYQFAKYIADNKLHFNHIIIHSMNPYGSAKMKEELKNSANNLDVVPFHILYNELN